MRKKGFLIFWFFLLFFFRILLPGSSMNEIQEKIFFPSFPAYLIPFWLKIMPERDFSIFWFFFYFFRNFHARVEYEWNSGLKFFLAFSAYHFAFWLKILPERSFLIFWIFLLSFLQFSLPGGVWTEFGTKIISSLSRLISSRFG